MIGTKRVKLRSLENGLERHDSKSQGPSSQQDARGYLGRPTHKCQNHTFRHDLARRMANIVKETQERGDRHLGRRSDHIARILSWKLFLRGFPADDTDYLRVICDAREKLEHLRRSFECRVFLLSRFATQRTGKPAAALISNSSEQQGRNNIQNTRTIQPGKDMCLNSTTGLVLKPITMKEAMTMQESHNRRQRMDQA